jgi:hypothetical protein
MKQEEKERFNNRTEGRIVSLHDIFIPWSKCLYPRDITETHGTETGGIDPSVRAMRGSLYRRLIQCLGFYFFGLEV